TVATGGKLWDAATGKLLHTYNGYDAVFSPDGKLLASCGKGPGVYLWDPATGKELRVLQGHESSPWALAFSPDGKVLATGSSDNSLRFWDPATGKETRCIKYGDYVEGVAFSPDGSLLAVSHSNEKHIRLLNSTTGKQLWEIPLPDELGIKVAF